jgi:hypothetical protein
VITLTDTATGRKVVIASDTIKAVRDYPAGQCWVDFRDGTSLQPQESIEQVIRMMQEETK